MNVAADLDRDDLPQRCTKIANRVCGGPPVRCWGWKARMWGAAWDAACIALGGDPKDFLP